MSEQVPWYQKNWRRLLYVIAGFLALGGILGAISDARELIPPGVTYWGTGILIVLLIAVPLLLHRYKLEWMQSGGRRVSLTGLGMQSVWFLVGIGVLLWIPRVMDRYGKPKELERARYDELVTQWEEVASDPVNSISVEWTFPKAQVRAKDFRALMAGLEIVFDDAEPQVREAPRAFKFRADDSTEDYQKSLIFEVVDHAGHSATAEPDVKFWKQFEGSDAWLCWWSSKFVWRNANDYACQVEVASTMPAGQPPFALQTLFSASDISIRAPYGSEVKFRGPEELPDPLLEITLWTKRGGFRLPLESFVPTTETNDNTKVKTIVVSGMGHNLRETMRDEFFKKGGLPSKDPKERDQEVHAVTGTVNYLAGFFPRQPTAEEWEKMRQIHPELVPSGH